MKTLRQTSRTLDTSIYVDPANFADQVALKSKVQPKKAGSLTVHNVSAALNAVRIVNLPSRPDCVDACAPRNQERLSCRISFSGSTASKAELKRFRQEMFSLWLEQEDDLISGFLTESVSLSIPDTVPVTVP